MFKWIRNPLFLMLIVELAVVSLLVVVAWNVVGAAAKPALAPPPLQWPASPADQSRPGLPELSDKKPDQRGPLPGLNLDSSFWQQRLRELNRDQAHLEQIEWRIVHVAMDTIKRYLETVVLPSIRHAEQAGGSLMN